MARRVYILRYARLLKIESGCLRPAVGSFPGNSRQGAFEVVGCAFLEEGGDGGLDVGADLGVERLAALAVFRVQVGRGDRGAEKEVLARGSPRARYLWFVPSQVLLL